MKTANTSAVGITIGGQTRIYHAIVTTAPVMFDGPSTLTLYASSFADIAGFAADPSRSTRRWAERQRGWC